MRRNRGLLRTDGLSAVSGGRKEPGNGFLEGKRSLTLLTHHQPDGWSPALEKGG